jgi:C4-dicarboxylate-specific signal transduction histidine kinase/CheY-like chemotaxis protein
MFLGAAQFLSFLALEDNVMLSPIALILTFAVFATLAGLWWWVHEKRTIAKRRSMQALHTLSEEIISATSPSEIAAKLLAVLPSITRATSVRLYLLNRRSKSLECVQTNADLDPMAVPLDSPPDGLAGGAVACFRNRTLLNVPDVRRSPFLKVDTKTNLPRSAMFVPLFSQNDVAGVLEVGNENSVGYFTPDEQAAAQHLANQVAASLRLQEQRTVREQLFRSEKLAATGQLISGVANDLSAPLENILQLATSLATYKGRPVPEHYLRELASESLRASEIVSRLVSFAHPEDSAARHVDVNAVVTSLMQFREPEWKTLELRVQNRLAPAPAVVLGAQGQIEQVFLNLLVHAEQCASEAPGKTITVASSVIAGRVLVEITYPAPASQPGEESDADPFAEGRPSEGGALGLGVWQGVIQGHGGELRFRTHLGASQFEVDLPLAFGPAPEMGSAISPLTLMLVGADPASQRQILALLSARGHRVVPVPPEEAPELAQRLRFDAVVWTMRLAGSRWSAFQERIRPYVPAYVLLTDGFDPELTRSLENTGGFLLVRPIKEAELDRVLTNVAERASNSQIARPAR